MPAKKKKPPVEPGSKTGFWDFMVHVSNLMANLADKTIVGLTAFTACLILLVFALKWPDADLPEMRKDLMQPLVFWLIVTIVILLLAFYILIRAFRRRLAEQADMIRNLQEALIPGRISSARQPVIGQSTTAPLPIQKQGTP